MPFHGHILSKPGLAICPIHARMRSSYFLGMPTPGRNV